jgi:hypothetical protein
MPRKKTNSKEKMGTDPLKWVKDSREDKKPKKKPASEPAGSTPTVPQEDKPEKPISERGLPDGWTRWAVITRKEYLDKVKAYAYWERMDIKQVLDMALEEFLKGKKIKNLPEGK